MKDELKIVDGQFQDISQKYNELKSQYGKIQKEKAALESSLDNSEQKKEEAELSLARVRGELYELKEKCGGVQVSDSDTQTMIEKQKALEEKILELQEENSQTHRDNDALLIKMKELKDQNCVIPVWKLQDEMISDIAFEEVLGEKKDIYHGQNDSVNIYIDLNNKMIQMEKPVKQVNKVYKKLEVMNSKDLSVTFYTRPKMVIGRKYGGDSLKEALSLLLTQMNQI